MLLEASKVCWWCDYHDRSHDVTIIVWCPFFCDIAIDSNDTNNHTHDACHSRLGACRTQSELAGYLCWSGWLLSGKCNISSCSFRVSNALNLFWHDTAMLVNLMYSFIISPICTLWWTQWNMLLRWLPPAAAMQLHKCASWIWLVHGASLLHWKVSAYAAVKATVMVHSFTRKVVDYVSLQRPHYLSHNLWCNAAWRHENPIARALRPTGHLLPNQSEHFDTMHACWNAPLSKHPLKVVYEAKLMHRMIEPLCIW